MVVSRKNGSTLFKYGSVYFHAREGAVHIFCERNGEETVASASEFAERIASIGLEADRCIYLEERLALKNAADEMAQCAKEALAQGDLTEQQVRDYKARHRSKPATLVGPGTYTGQLPTELAAELAPKLIIPGV